MNKVTKHLMLGLSIGLVPLISSTAWAHVDGKYDVEATTCGYVGDSNDKIVTDDFGKCVKTGVWSPELAIEECEGIKKVAAAPPPSPPPPPPPPEPVIEKITLSAEVRFDFDKSSVRPEGKQELDELVEKLAAYKDVEEIVITGHTDSVGTNAYNQKLSERRANTVMKYLADKGIEKDTMQASGEGELKPAATNGTSAGRQLNRRVELDIVSLQQK